MAFETQVKAGGAWKSGLLIAGRVAGVWEDITEVYAKASGSWEQVYVRSNPITYTYEATAGQSYRDIPTNGSGGTKRGGTSDEHYQAEYNPSDFGEQGSMFLFDYAQIQADTAVRPTITKVEIEIANTHSYYGSGWGIRIVDHNRATFASAFSYGVSVYDSGNTNWITKGGSKKWDLGAPGITLGEALRDGTKKGMSFWKGNIAANTYYYGYADPASIPFLPKLYITCDY